jgi:hypothetical protein
VAEARQLDADLAQEAGIAVGSGRKSMQPLDGRLRLSGFA